MPIRQIKLGKSYAQDVRYDEYVKTRQINQINGSLRKQKKINMINVYKMHKFQLHKSDKIGNIGQN